MSEPELATGQVWHFHCSDVTGCDDYYLLLVALTGPGMLTGPGTWEAFDLVEGELTYVCPCGAGDWELIG